jgi:hypothetical protein
MSPACRPFRGKVPVFGIRRVEVPASRFVGGLVIAIAGFVDMERDPFSRRQTGYFQRNEHTFHRLS